MAVHFAAPAGLANRILSGIGRLHCLSGGIFRVLQPKKTLDAFNHRQHLRFVVRLQVCSEIQSGYFHVLHCVPDHDDGRNSVGPRNHLLDAVRRHNRCFPHLQLELLPLQLDSNHWFHGYMFHPRQENPTYGSSGSECPLCSGHDGCHGWNTAPSKCLLTALHCQSRQVLQCDSRIMHFDP